MQVIYLDNAATTQPYPEVVDAMTACLRDYYGNPSSLYGLGQKSKIRLDNAREIIAASINADPDEIYFTSGGSEADNWAIRGIMDCEEWRHYSRHMITSKIEHPAVLNTCSFLENRDIGVTYLDVDEFGRVNLSQLTNSIRDYTLLTSIMLANNEIGTLQNIGKISRICKDKNVLLHVDAVQAYGQIPIDVHEMGIDMLSASAHKVHGPKGIGFLYIRKGVKILPLIYGGHQEHGLRAGTENVPGIVGFAKAVNITMSRMKDNVEHMNEIREHIIRRVLNEIPRCRLNGDRRSRLPNNINLSFDGLEGESLLILLDMDDVCVSSGSACMSGQQEPSYVLKAIGLSDELAKGTIRVTIDAGTTLEEANKFVDLLIKRVSDLRR